MGVFVNKSHAAAYAVVGFQTAYLMHYYPTEFIASMLNSVMGSSEKVAFYIRFAKELGIELLLPDINESYAKFTVQGDKIRFGLAAVKNVGFNVIESIVKSREEKGKFTGLTDFCNKIDISCVNKRAVESLIKAGAFDTFKVFRSRLLAVYEKVLDGVGSQRKKNIDGQISLFESAAIKKDNNVDVEYPQIKEFNKKYMLAMEKEMTGLYLSGHPLDDYEETLKLVTNTKISDIIAEESLEDNILEVNSAIEAAVNNALKVSDGDRVIIGGIISEVSKKVTKSNTMMAFMRVEDLYGSIEAIVFPKTLEKYGNLINMDEIVMIKGRVSLREDEQPKLLCEDIQPLTKVSSSVVYLLIDTEKNINHIKAEIKPKLLEYSGNTPVCICTSKERKKFMLDKELWIDESIEILEYLRTKFGEKCVKVLQ